MKTQEISRITNRHIAQVLGDVECLCPDLPSLAKVAIKRQMRFLAQDIEDEVAKYENAGKQQCSKTASSNSGDPR